MVDDPLVKVLEELEDLRGSIEGVRREIGERIDRVEKRLGTAHEPGSLESVRNEVVDLQDTFEVVVQRFQELAARLEETRASAEQDDRKGPWWWPGLNREDAQNAWQVLVGWVDVLADRYPDSFGDGVRGCWFAHPVAVDELSALYWAWKTTYDEPKPHGAAPLDWIGRHVTDVARRVREHTGSCAGPTGCERLGGVRPKDVTERQRSAFINADLNSRRPGLRSV